MFVQTHFQRARHQATGANSSSSSSTAATGHHNHNNHHHHLLQSHSHSSASNHHHYQQEWQHDNQREPGNHANHSHNQQQQQRQQCERSPRATVDQRGQTIGKSVAHKIKGENKHRAHDGLLETVGVESNYQVDKFQKSTTHSRHAHALRRESEIREERNERQQDHEEEIRHYHHHSTPSRQQQMGSVKVTTIGSEYSTRPVGSSSIESESSTTLRLRSASLSRLGGDNDQVIRLRSQQSSPRGGFRSSSSSSRPINRGRSSRALRLDRCRRSTSNHKFEVHLERILTTLIGPSVIVGRSLTNKIFASDHSQGSFDVHRDETTRLGTKYTKLTPGSHLNLRVLTAQLKRTLHCLVLFFVNFLQFHLQIARQILTRIFLTQLNTSNDGQANSVTRMRAQRRQRPPSLASTGAYSFDGTRTLAPHEFASTNAAAALYLQNHHRHEHHHQLHQHNPPVWISPLMDEPVQPTTMHGHVHRHNHNVWPAEPLQHAPFVVSPAIGRYRSLDCDAMPHQPSGPYATHLQRTVAQPASTSSYLPSHQHHQAIPPAATRRNVAADPASQMWKWHMRHTVDGYPPGEAQEQVVGGYSPSVGGGSFDHAHYDRQPAMAAPTNAGHSHAHRPSHMFATSAGMFHRQHRLASISSPTLSEYDGSMADDCWSGLEPADDTRQQVVPTYVGPARAYQPAETCGPQSNLGGRRQLPMPPTRGVPAHQRLAPAPKSESAATHQQSGGSSMIAKVRQLDRRLSSIMGSDSELYAAKRDGAQPLAPTSGATCNSSDDASVSSASRLRSRSRANANLLRYQLGKQASNIQHCHRQRSAQEQPESSPNKAIVDVAADRRRLARQASSAASTSRANSASVQRAGASDRARARANGTAPKLPHQFNSLQANSPQHAKLSTTSVSPQLKAPSSRLTKSDTESKSPMSGDASQVIGAQPSAGTGSEDVPSRKVATRPTSAKTTSTTVKSLAAGGKSKSVLGAHASPIGVLGRAVSLAGAKRRLGFKQKGGLNSLSVHRSEEYFPAPHRGTHDPHGGDGGSAATTASNSLNSDSCEAADPSSSSSASRWLSQFGGAGSHSPDPRVCFVEGLGAGQIASRQALVSPYLGDIQVSLSDRRGMLEVEIIRVRQLQPKPGAKRLPSPYVKVYLMRNKKCAAKFKTRQLEQTLDPLYQQLFIFRDSDYSNCVLQIIVWAYYGKKDRKSLMGIVQIHLNDLDMSQLVIGWYKLFNAPSMVAATASSPSVATSSKALRQTLSSTKLGDLATIQKQHQQPAVGSVESQQKQVNNKSQ